MSVQATPPLLTSARSTADTSGTQSIPGTVSPLEVLAKSIRSARMAQGLTQAKFTAKWGLNLSMVQAIETGRRRFVTGREIDLIAVACSVLPTIFWRDLGLDRAMEGRARYIALVP